MRSPSRPAVLAGRGVAGNVEHRGHVPNDCSTRRTVSSDTRRAATERGLLGSAPNSPGGLIYRGCRHAGASLPKRSRFSIGLPTDSLAQVVSEGPWQIPAITQQ
jgi:hypothetical protein